MSKYFTNRFIKRIKPRLKWSILIFTGLVIGFQCLPVASFPTDQYSLVLDDKNGNLLGARIASDGQWRFPVETTKDSIDNKYVIALETFEDRRFRRHFGVDLRALLRAASQNLKSQRTVSGASTITMQAISLYRGRKAKNVFEKLYEILLAIRLELHLSKTDILELYANHAPFGGNTVGYSAATWRYFGKHNKSLTWAEAALLAVLPNSPSMIHLARNREKLLKKRNQLLASIAERGFINKEQLALYVDEPLPDKPYPMPTLAPHLLTTMKKVHGINYLQSTIDGRLQSQITNLAERYGLNLKANQVHNLAILIAEVNTGNVLAYIGNMPNTGALHGEDVDIIRASRSTGSLLKPFLTMFALKDGMITPQTLLTDIPVNIDGFKPDNFNYEFAGSVPVRTALQKSHNVPFVLLLRDYNSTRFLTDLRNLGLKSIHRSAAHYGLSLIIGGAESSLWELCGAYASCGRILNHYNTRSSRYFVEDIHTLNIAPISQTNAQPQKGAPVIDAGSLYQTFDIMSGLQRPGRFAFWSDHESATRVAWKTGTSIGFRDAWAIGLNADYVVGVWIGNADGEGRPGVIGLETAAPLLFETFSHLPSGRWFDTPYDAMIKQPVCRNSGLAPNPHCPIDSVWLNKNTSTLKTCTFDKLVHLDKTGQFQVTSNCYNIFNMQTKSYFVLPANQAHYYKFKHANYLPLPPFHPDCLNSSQKGVMNFIYPVNVSKIYLPKAASGNLNPITLEIAHNARHAKVHWHIDEVFYGTTMDKHTITLILSPGNHTVKCIDEDGNSVESRFEVLHSEK